MSKVTDNSNHRLSANDILKNDESNYSLVIAVAKRARTISEDAVENGEILIEKPVQIAIEEFARGKYILKESDDCHD